MAASAGGGIDNDGTATVTGSSLLDNSAPNGGGITNLHTLAVKTTTMTGNVAFGTIASDVGGAVYNDGGQATITDTTLSGNAAAMGGGIANQNGATVDVADSTLSAKHRRQPHFR